MQNVLRIGTRDSQLAVWQATWVQNLLKESGVNSELVYIKSEGDVDTITPLYELGVTGIFTKTLDSALLNNRIDIAVHSMKDVPTQLAKGIRQAAVLKRASYKDILVLHPKLSTENAAFTMDHISYTVAGGREKEERWTLPLREHHSETDQPEDVIIATGSIRRIAQWKNRYPNHNVENLRGNVNTRLRKLEESNWYGAIFAAAGLERINLRPQNSLDLDWMLPAPAQGAVMVVCREEDETAYYACQVFDDKDTALCTKIERDFLRTLMGGCSTPISALAIVKKDQVIFKGNICSPDGSNKVEIEENIPVEKAASAGVRLANQLINQPSAAQIVSDIRNAKK